MSEHHRIARADFEMVYAAFYGRKEVDAMSISKLLCCLKVESYWLV